MLSFAKGRLTYANVVASLALFVALGGASYAAVTLPRNSVGTRQIRKHAVTLAKISRKARRHLHGVRGAPGRTGPTGPQGPQGVQGAPGPQGVAGSARAYAEVNPGAVPTFRTGKVHGFSAVSRPTTGEYCLTPASGVDPASSAAVVSPLYNSALAGEEFAYRWEQAGSPCASGQFTVVTTTASAAGSDGVPFAIAVP